MFILLPVELMVLIISFLPTVLDKIRLRCVSKALRSVCDTPSLWRNFEWPRYEDRKCVEFCIHSLLKSFGEHVKVLSFPNYVPPLKLEKMLDYCPNVNELNIPTTELCDVDQVRSVLGHMKHLQKLDMQWNHQTCHLLKLTFDTDIKEFTIHVNMNIIGRRADKLYNQFVSQLYAWIKEWIYKGFVPQRINFTTSGFDQEYDTLVSELFRVWLRLNSDSPAEHTGFLTFYNTTSLDLFPAIPEFQLEFGQKAVLPIMKSSDFGVLGLQEWVFLTKCDYKDQTIYKAAFMESCKEVSLNYVGLSNFNCVVHFDLSCCGSLHSGHLEQIAVACPNLQRLNMQYSKKCLTNLKGLRLVATHCNQLKGLDIMGVTEVENQVMFWEVLSGMRLTHLALDACVTEPTTASDKQELIELYQKLINLTAIELHFTILCRACDHLKSKKSLLFAYFPSLEFCIIPNIHPMALQDVVTGCKELKFLNCKCNNGKVLSSVELCSRSLQEIHLNSSDSDLTDAFMNEISAHGGLVHVVLNINSMASKGITLVVLNSPDLLTFHIFLNRVQFVHCDLACTPKEYHKRNVFTVGSHKLVQGSYPVEHVYEHNPNLLSLWKLPFWCYVEVENVPVDTDVLTTADFDTDTCISEEELCDSFDEFFH